MISATQGPGTADKSRQNTTILLNTKQETRKCWLWKDWKYKLSCMSEFHTVSNHQNKSCKNLCQCKGINVQFMDCWRGTFCDWLQGTFFLTTLSYQIVYLGEKCCSRWRYGVSQKGTNWSMKCFPCWHLPSWWFATWCHMPRCCPAVPIGLLKLLCRVCGFGF